MIPCGWIRRRMRNVSGKSCRENQDTHFMFNKFFTRESWRLWCNVEKHGTTAQTTISLMRFACWVTKATDTHSVYVIITYCFSTATTVTPTHLNVTFTYIAGLVLSCLHHRSLIFYTFTNNWSTCVLQVL